MEFVLYRALHTFDIKNAIKIAIIIFEMRIRHVILFVLPPGYLNFEALYLPPN